MFYPRLLGRGSFAASGLCLAPCHLLTRSRSGLCLHTGRAAAHSGVHSRKAQCFGSFFIYLFTNWAIDNNAECHSCRHDGALI